MTDGEFVRFLAEQGLRCAGSSETIYELRKQFGIRRWFDFLDVVQLPPASLFPEQTEPFFFLTSETCLIPPSEFECDFDYFHDGRKTFELALERLTALFGPHKPGTAVNTVEASWKFERMSIRIRTFLKENTPSGNPLYARHPELWNFCRISIERNWVQRMSPPEREFLRSLKSSEMLKVNRSILPRLDRMAPWDRGLFRLGDDGQDSPIESCLFRRDSLIGWCCWPWAAFIDRASCKELRHLRMLPARSAGDSQIDLKLPNPFSLAHELVTTPVLYGAETAALDAVAPAVTAFWGIPLKTEEYLSD